MTPVPDTFPSLFAGYTVLWLLIVFYVFSLGKRMRSLEKRFGRNSSLPREEDS